MDNYLKELNNKKKSKKYNCIKEYAMSEKIPIIEDEGLEFLKLMIKTSNAKNILEIGGAIGYSAINIASLGCNVTSIEIEKNLYDIARSNIDKYKMNSKINFIQGDALDIDLRILDDEYDLIFIDAAKSKYSRFIEKFEVLLKEKGLIITDNLLFHGLVIDEIKEKNLRKLVNKIKKFNVWILENEKYDSYIYKIGDGICVSIKR